MDPQSDLLSKLRRLFFDQFGVEPDGINPLTAHASNRIMYRLSSKDRSAIGIIGPVTEENDAFVKLTDHFSKFKLPVPIVYHYDASSKIILEEDLGNTTLLDLVNQTNQKQSILSDEVINLYQSSLEFLSQFQVTAGESLDPAIFFPDKTFGRSEVLKDTTSFASSFLGAVGLKFDQASLGNEFNKLAEVMTEVVPKFFMYRDFQARNIMVAKRGLVFIDYQSGRAGPLQYDVVSLLFQASARLTDSIRDSLLEHYLDSLEKLIEINRKEFKDRYPAFIVARMLQVLGVYGTQGLRGGKEYFLKNIPGAVRTLHTVLTSGTLSFECSELSRITTELIKIYPNG